MQVIVRGVRVTFTSSHSFLKMFVFFPFCFCFYLLLQLVIHYACLCLWFEIAELFDFIGMIKINMI